MLTNERAIEIMSHAGAELREKNDQLKKELKDAEIKLEKVRRFSQQLLSDGKSSVQSIFVCHSLEEILK